MNTLIPDENFTQNRQRRAMSKVELNGGLPAIVPTWLLEHHLWHESRHARCHPSFRRVYYEPPARFRPIGARIVVETSNDLPITKKRSQAGGLLQYLDLDLAVALARSWTLRGQPYFECYQSELLHWMGIAKNAPYRGLKGSFDRLRRTAIAMYIENTPSEQVSWFTILERLDQSRDCFSQGQPRSLQITLSKEWTSALESLNDWTVIDLDIYANLVRTNRKQGFARMLYLFLATKRDRYLRFEINFSTWCDRFADRLPSGRRRYRDPFNPESRLHNAMKVLVKSGSINFDGSNDGVISGKFLRPPGCIQLSRSTLPSLDSPSGRQMELPFNPGIFGDPPPQCIDKKNTVASHNTLPLPFMANALLAFAPGLQKCHIRDALKSGWNDATFGHLLGYCMTKHDQLDNSCGYIRTELEKGSSDSENRNYRWSKIGIEQQLLGIDYKSWRRNTLIQAKILVDKMAGNNSK